MMTYTSRMNRLDFDSIPQRRQPGGFWLGFISLLVGITLIGPPLAVLYDMNDELLRTSINAASGGVVETMYRVPPLSVPRFTYFSARAVDVAASMNAVLLCVIGVLTIRSRRIGVRLLGINSVAHVAFMIAMALTAARFSAALDGETAKRVWTLGTPYGSSVRASAIWAALPGIVYPLVLLYLFARHRKGARAGRLVR